MSFLEDRAARRFFWTAAAVCLLSLLLALLLSLFHANALRAALLERERTVACALLEQGVHTAEIAEVLGCTHGSESADRLLGQLGRSTLAPFWLLTAVRRRVWVFLCAALAGACLPALAWLTAAARYLSGRERLFRTATDTVARFAEGDFSRRLPCAGEGAVYRLFAAAEQLSTALQSRIDAGQRSREFLKEMVSDISHQLKTPLAALQMYAEIIAAEPDEPETVRAFAGKSLASVARMEGLTGALLKIARLDAGSITFGQEEVPVRELAARAAAELQTRAAREGKRLTLEGDPALTLRCDPGWTSEALGNLIKNALDHTAAGDEIAVRWERSPAMCRLTVADTGEGIAPADLHHIFKRFYRSPSSRNTQGVGLGLPLARAVIEGQGGTITVESEPGRGTAFQVAFLAEL